MKKYKCIKSFPGVNEGSIWSRSIGSNISNSYYVLESVGLFADSQIRVLHRTLFETNREYFQPITKSLEEKIKEVDQFTEEEREFLLNKIGNLNKTTINYSSDLILEVYEECVEGDIQIKVRSKENTYSIDSLLNMLKLEISIYETLMRSLKVSKQIHKEFILKKRLQSILLHLKNEWESARC